MKPRYPYDYDKQVWYWVCPRCGKRFEHWRACAVGLSRANHQRGKPCRDLRREEYERRLARV